MSRSPLTAADQEATPRGVASPACLTGTVVATQYFAAMSIDGFIAGPGNTMDRLVQLESGEARDGCFGSFFSRVGATAMGGPT